MIHLTLTERERIYALAKRLNTAIPNDISIVVWSLPLLKVLVDRLEQLERKLGEQQKG